MYSTFVVRSICLLIKKRRKLRGTKRTLFRAMLKAWARVRKHVYANVRKKMK